MVVPCYNEEGNVKLFFEDVLNTYKDHNCSILCICLLRDGRFISGDKKGKLFFER